MTFCYKLINGINQQQLFKRVNVAWRSRGCSGQISTPSSENLTTGEAEKTQKHRPPHHSALLRWETSCCCSRHKPTSQTPSQEERRAFVAAKLCNYITACCDHHRLWHVLKVSLWKLMVGSVGFVPAAPERTTETDDCWVSTLGSNICEQRCVICAYMAALTSEMSERVSQPTETYHSKIWIAVSLAPWDLGRTETVTSGDVERWSSGGKWWQ